MTDQPLPRLRQLADYTSEDIKEDNNYLKILVDAGTDDDRKEGTNYLARE